MTISGIDFRSPWMFSLLSLWLVLAMLFFGAGCGGPKLAPLSTRPGMHPVEISGHKVWCSIAADNASRQRGLMHRDSMPEDVGMLFIFTEASPQGFWMKNCAIDLDIAYIDDDGIIVDILMMKAPEPNQVLLPRYRSSKPVRYALETNVGWFAARGLKPGIKVTGYKGPSGLRVR
ncbi:MAG: DUF192 domain-containing protein [Planctomycetota bacterium]